MSFSEFRRSEEFNEIRQTELFQGGTDTSSETPPTRVKYPKNWVQTTSAGHRIEMNNTEDAERIRILNGNGNFIDLDEKNDNYLKSKNDTYILSDHNLVIKVGKDIKTDRVVLQVIGDVHLYVEGDMHTEVEGDRFVKWGSDAALLARLIAASAFDKSVCPASLFCCIVCIGSVVLSSLTNSST